MKSVHVVHGTTFTSKYQVSCTPFVQCVDKCVLAIAINTSQVWNIHLKPTNIISKSSFDTIALNVFKSPCKIQHTFWWPGVTQKMYIQNLIYIGSSYIRHEDFLVRPFFLLKFFQIFKFFIIFLKCLIDGVICLFEFLDFVGFFLDFWRKKLDFIYFYFLKFCIFFNLLELEVGPHSWVYL